MASHNVPRTATYEPKTDRQRQAELQEIAEYQSLVDTIERKLVERQYTVEILQLTTKLLTKNPEYYTIWNVRRRLLTYGSFSKLSDSSSHSNPSPNISPIATTKISTEDSSCSISTSSEASTTTPAGPNLQNRGRNGITLDLIHQDLAFLVPLLKMWPKCYWIWNHRMWLLHEAIRCLSPSVARPLWQEDLALVGVMLVKDSRNFHAWDYRRFLVAQLESPFLNGTSMVESEFEYTTKMVKANLSNFSAWHNRSKLITRLLNERGADDATRRRFLDEELYMMRNALWVADSDQSIWFYYQFLLTAVINPDARNIIVPNLASTERLEYIDRQLTDLRELLDGADNPKWIYTTLIDLTTAGSVIRDTQHPQEVRGDLAFWLAELRRLDPLRAARWNDMEVTLHIQR